MELVTWLVFFALNTMDNRKERNMSLVCGRDSVFCFVNGPSLVMSLDTSRQMMRTFLTALWWSVKTV